MVRFLISLIYLLGYVFCIFFTTKHYLHMFQLNSYKPKVQIDWILKNKKTILAKDLISLLIIPAMVTKNSIGLTLASIIFIILAYASRTKNAKKPLVYTKRIIRLSITLSILSIILMCFAFIPLFTKYTELNRLMFCLLTLGYYFLLPFIILIANYINMPIEKAINKGFINDAKRILKLKSDMPVIGITGSYGKTSVKYYLTQLLSVKYDVLMTPENYNTTLGVVRTIRENLSATNELFVCEMGARNVGDIKEICDLVHPRYGIITSIGPQHLESFKTLDNIKNTKFELANSLPDDGIVFLNANDENIASVNYKRSSITYGVDKGDYMAFDLILSSKGTSFKIKTPNGETEKYTTTLIGKHNVQNITGAIAMAHHLGINLKSLKNPVKRLEGVPHRLQLNKHGNTIIIDDAYNSNPNGTKVALDTLSMFDGLKILITPGMVELGDKQDFYNKEFGKNAAAICDYIILVGKNQTLSIAEGVKESNFKINKLYVSDTIQDALKIMHQIDSGDKEKIVLLENDLPDNFL